jgi:hypothetical protein
MLKRVFKWVDIIRFSTKNGFSPEEVYNLVLYKKRENDEEKATQQALSRR